MLENLISWYPQYLNLLLVVGVLVLLDWISGTAVAIKNKTFKWERIGDILAKWLLPILGWSLVDIVQILPPEFARSVIAQGSAYTAYLALVISMGASLVAHAQALGLPIDLKRVGFPPTLPDDQE